MQQARLFRPAPSHPPRLGWSRRARCHALYLLLATGISAASTGLTAESVVSVGITLPLKAQTSQQLSLSGSVSTPLDASLSPRISGLIAEVMVDAGDEVKKGQALLKLDDTLARLALKREDAALVEVQTRIAEAERLRREADSLSAKGNLPKSLAKTRLAEETLAKAQLSGARAVRAEQAERVNRHVLTAPFAGVIRQRLSAPGEWVEQGDIVFDLVSRESLRVDVLVPQHRLADVKLGQTVEVTVDAWPDRVFKGRVASRVSAADAQSRSFLIRVGLGEDAGDVLPGMSARVKFQWSGDSEGALSVPEDAVQRFPDGSTILWIVDEQDLAQRRSVQLGNEQGDRVLVLAGLIASDRVVVRGAKRLKAGMKVTAESVSGK